MSFWRKESEGARIRDDSARRSVPSGVFNRCTGCTATVLQEEMVKNLYCCPACGHHFTWPTEARLRALVGDEFTEWDAGLKPVDRLGFVDDKPYAERLRRQLERGDYDEAIITGTAAPFGSPLAIGCFVYEFMGGSMGSVVGERITRLFERATDQRLPVVLIAASGGARMQESTLSLMQMAKTTAALARFRAARRPFLSVLVNPTTGGVAASFASLGDVILAEPGALIGFAGPRVIEQTLRTKLPEGFQRSEFLLQHGMVDRVVPRNRLAGELQRLLALLTSTT